MVGVNVKDQVGAKPAFLVHVSLRILIISARIVDV
jgi:hypothetical protein